MVMLTNNFTHGQLCLRERHEVVKMQTQQKRFMQVDFSRQRLHSSIAGALRRKGIPNDLRGYDLVRGVVFGMMDHPEYSMEVALERAMERTSMPGAPRDIQEAYECLWECVESALREVDFHEDRDYSKRRMSNLETANAFIQRILREARKDYCYSSTIQFMREKNFENYFAYDILKNMIFKKLMDDDASDAELYNYAYRNTFAVAEIADMHKAVRSVDKEIAKILPENETMHSYVAKCVEEIYAKQQES